ncbi:hypothetical protein M0R72_04235 [Candidatus Pacearchaeota archaeon]|jgi:amino acid transporter|nr:hypothetical protein [Candidatus Pacearchaeota archaeon]
MEHKTRVGTWCYINLDLILSIFFIGILYLPKLFIKYEFCIDYNLIITIFITIFSVNFTVFALSKFLLENYPKIKEERRRKRIDSIFKTPIFSSVIGLIISVLFYTLNIQFLNNFIFIIYLFIFYSILSSYCVFKFLYEISIKRGNS